MLIGIFSAFGAAISWTYACSIWRQQTKYNKPLEINFTKNLFACIIFFPVFIFYDFSTDIKYIFYLVISGIIGIGLGDTFYLKSLQIIGTRKTLSIEALSPLIAGLTGGIFIKETLSIISWIGIIISTFSLLLIIKKQTMLLSYQSKLIPIKSRVSNYIYPFLSVACSVIAALISRIVLLASNLNPIQTTEIRLIAAIIFLLLITKFKNNFSIINIEKKEKIKFIGSIFLGTNLGIFLQQVVFDTLPLGIGWTLLSTSPVISLFFIKKEEGRITKEIIFTTISLVVGLSLVSLSVIK